MAAYTGGVAPGQNLNPLDESAPYNPYGGFYGKQYGGTYFPEPGGPVNKIDPRNFGKASEMLLQATQGQDMRGLSPQQYMQTNPWVQLANKTQAMQQGVARDQAATAQPLGAGIAGFKAGAARLPGQSINEMAQRAQIGQQGADLFRQQLGKGAELENIAYALAQKKKAGENLSGAYAEAEKKARDASGGGIFG
jgi:hypothetical protein